MNRIDRLTGMILMLQTHRVITAEAIAAHFEMSVRTVYRDIAALGEAGVPIVSEAGVGYSLMRGYHVPPVMFTEHEAAALFISGEVTEQIADDSLRGSLRAALLKIRSVLPPEKRDYLNRLKQSVGVRLVRGGPPEMNIPALMPLQEAVVQRKCIAMRYNTANRGAITERTVEPLGVLYYSRQWHLIGYCRLRQEVRDFRLDRMAHCEVTPEVFSGHEGFSMAEFLREEIRSAELTPVTLMARKEVMEILRNMMAGTTWTEAEEPHGLVRVEALAWSLNWVATWVSGLAGAVAAISPPELRERVRELAQVLMADHDGALKNFEPAKNTPDIGLSVGRG